MIRDEQQIAAGVDRVWALTVDVERWPELTPTVTSVQRLDDGPLGVGSRARVKQPAQRAAVWTVSRFEPGVAFEWGTRVGSVRMVGAHHLEAVEGGTRNVLTVELSGIGSGLVERLVGRRVREAIATENLGFKRSAEAVADGAT
jgi:uncharacterized membrane protein